MKERKRTIEKTWGTVCAALLLAAGIAGRAWAGDREEAASLVHAFAAAGDRPDAAAFRAMFVEKPSIAVGSRGAMAPEAFFKAWTQRLADLKESGVKRRQHVTTVETARAPDGSVSVTASILTTAVQENKPRLVDTGAVTVEAVRVKNAWKIRALKLGSDTSLVDAVRLGLEDGGK